MATGDIPTWVDEDHFIEVFEENVDGFKKIIKFEVCPAAGPGENFQSLLLRVKAQVELNDGRTEDISYILKTVPNNEQVAMMGRMMCLFPKEISLYTKYIPEFEQMYQDVGKDINFGPKYFTLKKNPGIEYVLLEDLCVKNFKNLNRIEGLNKEQTKSVLRILAAFHAASAVRRETKGEYDAHLEMNMFAESNRPLLELLVNSTKDAFLESLKKYPIGLKYLSKLTEIQDKLTDTFIKLSPIDPDSFNVLIHGDMWSNNIMFGENGEGPIIIDYALSRYAPPVFDLYYFLLTSPRLDIKVSLFDEFIKYYYDHLVENLKLLKYPKSMPTMKEFQVSLLKYGLWALYTSITTMAGALLDPSENVSVENLLSQETDGINFKMQLFCNPRYIKHMEVILPWMDARGLLDL